MPRPKNSRRRRILVALAVLAAGVWIVWTALVPRVVRGKVARSLEAAGLGPVRMDLPEVGLRSTRLSHISAGDPPLLTIDSIQATYSPGRLWEGGVKSLEVDGLKLRASLPASRPAAEASQTGAPTMPAAPVTASGATSASPPFDRLKVRNASVVLPAPQGAGDQIIPLQLEAAAGEDRQIRIAATASLGETVVVASAVATPAFDKIDWQIDATGLSSGMVAPWMPPAMRQVEMRNAQVSAAGALAAGQRLDVASLVIRAPEVSLGEGGRRLVVRNLEVSGGGNVQLSSSNMTATLVPGATLRGDVALEVAGKAGARGGAGVAGGPGLPLQIELGQVCLRSRSGTWIATAEKSQAVLGPARLAVDPWELSRGESGLAGRVHASLVPLDLAQLTQRPEVSGLLQAWTASGQLSGDADLVMTAQALRPHISLALKDGGLVNKDYQLSVEGISAVLTLKQLWPLQTETAERLTFNYAQMGKWELRDGQTTFSLAGDGSAKVEQARLGWAGGELWCEPFTVSLSAPVVRTTVGAKDLDLGKIIWVLSSGAASAEGQADLKLPVTFSWPQIQFGQGWAEARPGCVLHLSDLAGKVETWLTASDPRFVTDPAYANIRQRVVQALQNFRLQKFRADFARTSQDNRLLTTLTIQGAGNSENGQALNLNLKANDLDWLLSRYLALPRQR